MFASKSLFMIASLASLMACDSSARLQGNAAAAPPDGASRAYETCESSADCQGELRCIESSCQSSARSRLGDYYAALGRRSKDDPDASSRAYNLAITQYESEALELPADLLCEQGIALSRGLDNPQLAEAAARVLHKCILTVPLGSAPARAAMDALAHLSEAGLEAELLTRSEAAALYMTGKPAGPNVDDVKLTVTGSANSRRRSYKEFLEALQGPKAKAKFVSCWIDYVKASNQSELKLKLEYSYRFILDEDDASGDRAVLKQDPQSPAGAELAVAQRCVEATAEQIAGDFIKGMREDARWKSSFQIRLGE